MEASVSLSVSLKDVEWLNEYVPADIVREMWMKSEKLLTTPNALVQAPSFDGIFVRHSPDPATSCHTNGVRENKL